MEEKDTFISSFFFGYFCVFTFQKNSGRCLVVFTLYIIKKAAIIKHSVGLNQVRGCGVWDFWRVCSSGLVDEPGLGRVRSLVFPDLGLGSISACFWPNKFKVRAF